MAVTARSEVQSRWTRALTSAERLADEFGVLGSWVGPRTGPHKRSHGEKEDYVFRCLIVAWKEADRVAFPMEVRAETERHGAPDFLLSLSDGSTLGVEVTEAGEENYQEWMTRTEPTRERANRAVDMPFEPSTPGTANEIKEAISAKVTKFDEGAYRGPDACDLVVYDNTSWGGFLDKRQILHSLGRPNHLIGRFRQVHLVTGGTVYLDILGSDFLPLDVSHTYEIDYAQWVFDQVESLRRHRAEKLDWGHIAEEPEDLGKSERRALGSRLRVLLLHLLKWQHQSSQIGPSWLASINNARSEIYDLLTESPSLRGDLERLLSRQHPKARQDAATETGITLDQFSETCRYELTLLLDPKFLPGQANGREE
jgi:hypothetical protein